MHHTHRVLLFQADTGDKSSVHDVYIAQTVYLSYIQYDRTLCHPIHLSLCQAPSQFPIYCVSVLEALIHEVGNFIIVLPHILWHAGRWWCRSLALPDFLLLFGQPVGVHIPVGKQDAVFVIAAHTGSLGGHGEIDDGGRGGAFGDEVASEDQMVSACFKLDFGQKLQYCVECVSRFNSVAKQGYVLLTFIMTSMYIPDNNQPIPIMLSRK